MERIEKKREYFFIFIFILIIFLFFLIFEMFLRFFNYGVDSKIVKIEERIKEKLKEEYIVLNEEYINKYYPGARKDRIMEKKVFIKKDKDLRLGFVIGDSTAQGYPYEPNTSFSKITEEILNLYPDFKEKKIVNLATSAMSSYYVYDVSKKILKYNPSFIVIYSGHNEYYGTLGYFSKGSFGIKHFYLWLKEFKIVQLLLNIIEYKKIGLNMMEELYGNKSIYDKEIDKSVTKDFIKNIDKIVKLYSKKNIPVIIINPVSNIIDFPVFYQDSKYKDFAIDYYDKLNKNQIKDLTIIEDKINKDKESAILYYLRGLTRIKNGDNKGIEDLILAKDMDKIPFRAKSILNDELKRYYTESKYKNLYFIDLPDEFKKENITLYGNRNFCDHLHFNYEGNKIVSKYIVKKILEIYNVKESISISDEQIDKLIHKTELNDLIAYLRLESLIQGSPYSQMYLKYNLFDISNNIFYKNKELYENLKSVGYLTSEIYRFLINYYSQKEDKESVFSLIDSYSLSYQGDPLSFLFLARKARVEKDLSLADYYYSIAYLLSDRSSFVYKDIGEYFILRAKYEEKAIDFYINTFLKKYGSPKKYIRHPKTILSKIKEFDEKGDYELIKNLIYNISFFAMDKGGSIQRLHSRDKIVEGIKNKISSGSFSYSVDTIDYHIKNINKFLKKGDKKKNESYKGFFDKDDYLKYYVNKYPDRVFYYDNKKSNTLLIFVSFENGVFLVYTYNLGQGKK